MEIVVTTALVPASRLVAESQWQAVLADESLKTLKAAVPRVHVQHTHPRRAGVNGEVGQGQHGHVVPLVAVEVVVDVCEELRESDGLALRLPTSPHRMLPGRGASFPTSTILKNLPIPTYGFVEYPVEEEEAPVEFLDQRPHLLDVGLDGRQVANELVFVLIWVYHIAVTVGCCV
jgi:hypothetical protein